MPRHLGQHNWPNNQLSNRTFLGPPLNLSRFFLGEVATKVIQPIHRLWGGTCSLRFQLQWLSDLLHLSLPDQDPNWRFLVLQVVGPFNGIRLSPWSWNKLTAQKTTTDIFEGPPWDEKEFRRWKIGLETSPKQYQLYPTFACQQRIITTLAATSHGWPLPGSFAPSFTRPAGGAQKETGVEAPPLFFQIRDGAVSLIKTPPFQVWGWAGGGLGWRRHGPVHGLELVPSWCQGADAWDFRAIDVTLSVIGFAHKIAICWWLSLPVSNIYIFHISSS